MDPLAILCNVRDSFQSPEPVFSSDILPPPYVSNENLKELSLDIKSNDFQILNYDEVLNNLKIIKNDPNYKELRGIVDPWFNVSPFSFYSRNALRLATMDMIYHFCGNLLVALNPQVVENFRYASIYDNDYGFTEYLQYRWHIAQAFSFGSPDTINSLNNINTDLVDLQYGDLFTNWDNFIKYVQKYVRPLDLVVANGFNDDPKIMSRLIMTESLVALNIGDEDSNFIMRLGNDILQVEIDLLYLLAQCYDVLIIFKPVISDDNERYLICKELKENDVVAIYSSLLRTVVEQYTVDKYISKFLKIEIPKEFMEWINENNGNNMREEIRLYENILEYSEGREVNIEEVDVHLIPIRLSIPSWRGDKIVLED